MLGLISESIGWMPLVAFALLVAVALLGSLVVHLWLAFWRTWARIWRAVALIAFLNQPWRVAWDRARGEDYS